MKIVNCKISAFTLLESLIVLGITSFLIMAFSSNLLRTVHIVKGELFVLQFEQIYKNTQNVALLKNQTQILKVQNGEIDEEHKIQIPQETQFDNFSVKFDGKSGNTKIQKFSIYLPYEKKKITYQIQLGSGKYRKTVE